VAQFVFLRSVRRLLVTANVVPSLPILVILMMEELRSSETFVLTRSTRRNIPEEGILRSLESPLLLMSDALQHRVQRRTKELQDRCSSTWASPDRQG
jgi:hypothetical protein